MFKLLTEEERQKVTGEYVIRRTVIFLLALVLVLAVGIIGLLPSYVLSNARQSEVLDRVRIMGVTEEETGESDIQIWLAAMNRKLQVLSPTLDTDRPSDFVEKILDEKIAGISITAFSWLRVKNEITLSVSGVAFDRQTLISFENRIDSSNYFSKVTFPISNLTKDRDIDFQIKFSLASSTLPSQAP
jgi:hypothetical protein